MSGISQSLFNAKIMMVDDEPITMYVVQTYLEDFGYSQFNQVEDSTTAITIMKEYQPDILLLDLVMPDVSGFDILIQLRSLDRFKYLPVIVLTGSSASDNKLKALELGATDFLAKPVDQSELRLRMRNTLAAKAYMDQLAFYDPLTKLPNKHMFSDRFEWALQKAKRNKGRLALINLTIDDFSRILATLGGNAMDIIICEIGKRLEHVVRNIDTTTFSQEGSEVNLSLFKADSGVFFLLLDRTSTLESSALIAEQILKHIRPPIELTGDSIFVTVSIGIATYPGEGDSCQSLKQLAASAKEFTLNQGGDDFNFSSSVINDLYQHRLNLELNLRKALERDEFLLHFQPKIDIQTGVIKGAEALIRWKSEENGLIPPGDFIPLLEETGLIVPVGEWVLTEAYQKAVQWSKTCKVPISISINLSVKQLDDPNFFNVVEKLVQSTSIDPQFIKLEITESLLLDDIEVKIGLLNAFRELGLKISIDDFGTGYSSLGYLSKLPLDELKIDRSFIIDVAENKDSQAIVSSIVFLAKSLGLSTVAEGIEDPQQLDFLKSLCCNEYQGFFFSRPLPEAEFTALLSQSNK